MFQIDERKGFEVAVEYDGKFRIQRAEQLLPGKYSVKIFTANVKPTSNSSIRNSLFVPASPRPVIVISPAERISESPLSPKNIVTPKIANPRPQRHHLPTPMCHQTLLLQFSGFNSIRYTFLLNGFNQVFRITSTLLNLAIKTISLSLKTCKKYTKTSPKKKVKVA